MQLDSCGVWVLGASSVSPLLDLRVFNSRGSGVDLNEEDEEPDVTKLHSLTPEHTRGGEIHKYNKGQGHGLNCYLPKANQMEAVTASFTKLSTSSVEELKPLPACAQKHIQSDVFDPEGIFFRTGAHMPLLVFFGQNSRRSPEALVRREEVYNRRKGTLVDEIN